MFMEIFTGTGIEHMYMFLHCFKGSGNKYTCTYLCSMNEIKGSMHTVTEPGKKSGRVENTELLFLQNVALIWCI